MRPAIVYRQNKAWRVVDITRLRTIARFSTRRLAVRAARRQGYHPHVQHTTTDRRNRSCNAKL